MIVVRSCILISLLLVMGTFRVKAQNPVSINYTVDDGLPSNEVYDIFEDSLGYIWFATDHGISRFDGYSFKNYSTNDGLTYNTVFGFFEDRWHRIWMRTFNGTLCYMEKGAIYPYEHNDSLIKVLRRDFVETFAIDSTGDLWYMCNSKPCGLYHQDHKTGRVRKVKLQPGFNSFIREIDTDKFIAGIDLDNGPVDSKKNDSLVYADHIWQFNAVDADSLSVRRITRVARMSKGHYMFSFDNELIEFDNYRITKRVVLDRNKPINDIFADESGFRVCHWGVHSFAGDTLISFFRDTQFSRIQKDRRGSYWLGSYDGGVTYIPNINILEAKAQGHQEIQLMAHYKNSLFTLNKETTLYEWPLTAFGPDTSTTYWHLPGAYLSDISINPETEEFFYGSQVYTLDELRKNPFGKMGRSGFYRPSVPSYVRSSFRIGDSVFFAGNEGWSIADRNGEALYRSAKNGFSKFCFTLCMDTARTLWIAANGGLYTYRNNRHEPFHPADTSFRQRVTGIKCMPNGIVVVSTRGAGVLFIDKERVYELRKKHGLTTDLCGRLAVEDSVVWVCTNNGLNRIAVIRNGESLQFRITHMLTEHGLPSNHINDAFRYRDLLILATGKGLCWFDTRKVLPSTYAPTVYISEVKANQRPLSPDQALNYNDNNLQFSFIGLLYNNAGKVQYRYKLDGYETEWHYTRELRVHYFNLPAANYRFVVAAMNEDGMWSTKPATYEFTIPLHFSETWWFLLLVLLTVILLVGLGMRYYLKQRRARERITSDLLLAELKTLRSQMKPHFIFNSLSSIQHFILDSDEESAHLYLSRFSALMRKILENTQRNTISLTSEIETLDIYLSLETLRFGDNFEYTITIDSTIAKDLAEVPPMLIQPYVENAIWHGLRTQKNNPRLWVRFFPENETTLVCEIEDNGIGREASATIQKQKTHQSTGMKNIQERIGILNRVSKSSIEIEIHDLYDVDGNGAGTKVVLKLHHTLNT